MTEPTVHTFDLSGYACYCGRVHAAPTHTITRTPPPEWEMPVPGTPLAPWSPIPMCSVPPTPALSPEWADRLWNLARQPERPSLEPRSTFSIRVQPGQPIGWLLPRWDAFQPSGFVHYDRTVPPVGELLMKEIRRSAALALLTEFELRASEAENDLIYGSDPGRPEPVTEAEAYAKAEALLQRMEAEGEISFL